MALDPDVRLVSLTELELVGRGELEDAFLIELDLAEGCDADRLVERGPLALFHSELRSLRLKPSIALAPSPVGIILPTDHA